MKELLRGKALWCYDFEVAERNSKKDILYSVSGTNPFHAHKGEIVLNESEITIDGDEALVIPLRLITQLYLGFDEIYIPFLIKNYGMFWQPLRITLENGQRIYLIIDYHFITAKNKLWFETIKKLLE